ncbi:hypothetical protein KIL84_018898 [Mauremys mutica]|uniref:Uncharacterized protein n=1 Tax=Mauremys mutica TaxID=74926 RepID=A0A9D4BAQ0_9SAUR|nr:hypothetical protein KIL84_018898 [Mauremys mutica]
MAILEHQALLTRGAAKLNFEVEELAEESDDLFNIISSSTVAQVMLPVHPGDLKIAKSVWQTASSILPTCKKVEKKY